MNIPIEVMQAARAAYISHPGRGVAGPQGAAAQVIAEWARKEALREAAEVSVKSGLEWIDLWQPNARLPECWDFIASDIRALADGATS